MSKKLKDGEAQVKNTPHKEESLPLEGKSFVFTGELENFTRVKAAALVESLGGKVSSSVSSKTSFLVVGDEPGSKLIKAKQLNIPLLTEVSFVEMTQ